MIIGGGRNETLCGGHFTGEGDTLSPTCIAGEINAMIATKTLSVESPDTPAQCVPITVRGCFDLVAARGIRGGRGRCACHTEAPDAKRFDVPAICDDTTWDEAATMLNEHPMLLAADLRGDAHTPPADWDYSTQGPWKCRRPGCDVQFASDAAFRSARQCFLVAKGDKSDAGKKVTAARAKRYAETHPSQQGEFEPPCTDLNMIGILLDPLHAVCC